MTITINGVKLNMTTEAMKKLINAKLSQPTVQKNILGPTSSSLEEWKTRMHCVIDINHVANSRAVLTLVLISVAFKGNTVAMNLSMAISRRLRTDTVRDSILKYDPTLQPIVVSGFWTKLPVLATISSITYNGQVVRLARKSETAMLT